MVAGREASPGDVKATERLMEYWAHGKGAAKIQWGVPGEASPTLASYRDTGCQPLDSEPASTRRTVACQDEPLRAL